MIYENGVQKLLLTEEGYVTLADKKYHYYLKDHQGNNRVVVSQTGVVEEINHYYPFGGLFANADGVQPYKYNGKELDTTKGLNLYDYGARMYDPTLGRFTTMDPMAEKYYSVSPYAYCGNNPVNYIDIDGREVIALDEQSRKNIVNTLSIEEAQYVRFSAKGVLDVQLLNKMQSSSANYIALRELANSNTKYKFQVTSKDIEGQPFSKVYKGLTALPGAEYKPSLDSDVLIQTSEYLSEKEQVLNVAHEAYGHAYFYELNKKDKSYDYQHRYKNIAGEPEWDSDFGMYIIPNIRVESNKRLKEQIDIVTKQAEDNYDEREK